MLTCKMSCTTNSIGRLSGSALTQVFLCSSKLQSYVLPNSILPFSRIIAFYSIPFKYFISPLSYFCSQYDKVTKVLYLPVKLLGLLSSCSPNNS